MPSVKAGWRPPSHIGVPVQFWKDQAKAIEAFVKSKQLQPMEVVVKGGKTITAPKPKAPDIYGGIKGPHLHLNGKIYLLSDMQWAEFSQGIITDARGKLASAKKVGFEEGLMLSAVTQAMG